MNASESGMEDPTARPNLLIALDSRCASVIIAIPPWGRACNTRNGAAKLMLYARKEGIGCNRFQLP